MSSPYRQAEADRARRAFRRLDPVDRLVALLRYADELTPEQIAYVTGEPLWRVRECLATVRLKLLRAATNPWIEE